MLLLPAALAVAFAIRAAASPVSPDLQETLVADYLKNGLSWTDGALRMNQIQVIGTHNSYHIEAPEEEYYIQSAFSAEELRYSHAALDVQLQHFHVRNLELDLVADPMGGNYAKPLIRFAAQLPPLDDPAMMEKGTKVLHVPDIDYHTVCSTLVSCLQIIKKWLDSHPDSVPIPMMMEFKSSAQLCLISATFCKAFGAKVFLWDEPLLNLLDAEIRSVFGDEQLITPDDIRRGDLSLEASVLQYGWPDLDSARGRIFFLMDNGPTAVYDEVRDAYRNGRPNLEGRVLFTNSDPGEADCAFQKLNNATTDDEVAKIQKQVKAGYWVRTRADDGIEAIAGGNCSTSVRDAALRSGAQVVSTDFPFYGMSARWGCDYCVTFPDGKAAQCNPVNGPENCDGSKLEPAEYSDA